MSCIRHPNTDKCFETYNYAGHMCICMEDMHRGCLKKALKRSRNLNETVNDSENDYVLLEVDWELKFVHGIKRLHLYMKSDSALLRRDGNIKLADFGFCADLTKERAKRTADCRYVKVTEVSNSHEVHRGRPAWYDCG